MTGDHLAGPRDGLGQRKVGIKRDKVDVNTSVPRIPYRETCNMNAEGMYRHKKQSGGSGQFAEHLRGERTYACLCACVDTRLACSRAI